jgi:hypothetical protein
VVESSLDGYIWQEVDRKRHNNDFKTGWDTSSFAVVKSVECCFIRLTQTGKNHFRNDQLAIEDFEIFGTLHESGETKGISPPGTVPPPDPVPPASPPEVMVPFKKGLFSKPDPFDGIISYLTRKHGGNVHHKGIVTITSKPVGDSCYYTNRAPWSVADFTSESEFRSEDEPGQWICWDFHKLCVRPTHYTIKCYRLKSWVVESSLDGEAWTGIDRQTDNEHFIYRAMASFAVSNLAECRFIRLTQTGKSHCWQNYLHIQAVEFFGTLLE